MHEICQYGEDFWAWSALLCGNHLGSTLSYAFHLFVGYGA